MVELKRDQRLHAAKIYADVNAGIVVLRGEVPVQAWRQRAQRVARVVHGVRAVVDRIEVVPERRKDTVIAAEIRGAIRATAALSKLPIVVTVVEGVAELRGSISSWEEQELAQLVASGVPGVRFCQNQLGVDRGIRRRGIVLAMALYWVVNRTRLGMMIRAGASNRDMVRGLGIDIQRLYRIVFAGGVALAALAGMIAAPLSSVYPNMGGSVLIICFVVVVIGGIGSITGALIASLLVGFVDTFGKVFFAEFSGIGVYLLMAIILIWKPEGLMKQHGR